MTDLHQDQEITRITDNLSITAIGGVRRNSTSHFDKVITVCQESVADNISCRYSHYSMSDGEDEYETGECSYELFEEAANELYQDLIGGTNVLIHCHRGRSRSVSVAAAAIARTEHITDASAAINRIEQDRERANPNEELRQQLRTYINEYM